LKQYSKIENTERGRGGTHSMGRSV